MNAAKIDARPLIGIAHTSDDAAQRPRYLRELATFVDAGILESGGRVTSLGMPWICDRTSMAGSEVIAKHLEHAGQHQRFDGIVALVGCDKEMAGAALALTRLNVPSVILCSSTALCLDQFSANAMAMALEYLGLSPVASSGGGPKEARRGAWAHVAGKLVMKLIKRDLRPRGFLTKAAFENALTALVATGGSPSAMLHVLAIANEAKVHISPEALDDVTQRAQRAVKIDADWAGGTRRIAKRLLDARLLQGSVSTISGRSLRDEASAGAASRFKSSGSLAILRGNLAPACAVVNVADSDSQYFSGRARVFDCEDDATQAIARGSVREGDVLVVRYEGPKGGPGTGTMGNVVRAIISNGLVENVALVTDNRCAVEASGLMVVHVAPEAAAGGPIAALRDGDTVTIDIENRSIEANVLHAVV